MGQRSIVKLENDLLNTIIKIIWNWLLIYIFYDFFLKSKWKECNFSKYLKIKATKSSQQ